MNNRLGAFEVLTMAETIEQDSIDFYRKAARRFDDDERKKIFLLLAGWERKHQEVFSAMKRDLADMLNEPVNFDFSRILTSNPQRLAGLASSAPGSVSKTELTGEESREEILDLAITRERNIVGFYYNLIKGMGDFIGKDKINDVIREEQNHIGILTRAMEKMKAEKGVENR